MVLKVINKQKLQSRKGTQSISRAVAILRTVSEYKENGVNLSTIARKSGLHVATTRRILQELLATKLTCYDSVSKCYNIGTFVYSLASAQQYSSIRELYRLSIENIVKKIGESVFLVVKLGNDSMVIDRVEGNQTIQVQRDIGHRLPLGIGTGGISILSSLPKEEADKIISANKFRYANYNNMTEMKVRSLVKRSVKLGYSISKGTYTKGASGISLSIYNAEKKVIGAITVALISERMNSEMGKNIADIIKSEIRGYIRI